MINVFFIFACLIATSAEKISGKGYGINTVKQKVNKSSIMFFVNGRQYLMENANSKDEFCGSYSLRTSDDKSIQTLGIVDVNIRRFASGNVLQVNFVSNCRYVQDNLALRDRILRIFDEIKQGDYVEVQYRHINQKEYEEVRNKQSCYVESYKDESGVVHEKTIDFGLPTYTIFGDRRKRLEKKSIKKNKCKIYKHTKNCLKPNKDEIKKDKIKLSKKK